jgi:hypothetical protein
LSRGSLRSGAALPGLPIHESAEVNGLVPISLGDTGRQVAQPVLVGLRTPDDDPVFVSPQVYFVALNR